MRRADDLYSPAEAALRDAAIRSTTSSHPSETDGTVSSAGESVGSRPETVPSAIVMVRSWKPFRSPAPPVDKELPTHYMPDDEERADNARPVRTSLVMKVCFVVAIILLAGGIAGGAVWVVRLKHKPQVLVSFSSNPGAAPSPCTGAGCTLPLDSASDGTSTDSSKGAKYGDPLPTGPVVGNDTVQITDDGRSQQSTAIDPSLFDYPYDSILGKSFLFYEAQRSGELPSDNRVTWRGTSTLDDGSDLKKDLRGGWFEAGNRLKITFPTAYSVAQLAWGCAHYKATYSNTTFQGQTNLYWCLREVKWGARYILKTNIQNSDGSTHALVTQVGNRHADFAYYGRAENMTMDRPTYMADGPKVAATEVGAQAAAALAATAYLFKDDDPEFSQQCMASAKAVYYWSDKYRGLYSDSDSEYAKLYAPEQYEVHLFYAAAMMYYALKCDPAIPGCDQAAALVYFNDALQLWNVTKVSERCYFPVANWDNPCLDALLLLVQATGQSDSTFAYHLQQFVEAQITPNAINGLIVTPEGLRMHPDAEWAALRNTANAAHITLMYSDLPGLSVASAQRARCYARSQLGYILGDTGYSYVVGAGVAFPVQVHHRDASCTFAESRRGLCRGTTGGAWLMDRPNPNVVVGALVGGPNSTDTFLDLRAQYRFTEVALDYNAALASALAGMAAVPSDFWRSLSTCHGIIDYASWPAAAS